MKLLIFGCFISMNMCFAQNADTLYLCKDSGRGTVIMKDSMVGLMNNFFFYDKNNFNPITGIVLMKHKPDNMFYYLVYNGIAKKKVDVTGNQTIYEKFENEKYSSTIYKNNNLYSIYNVEKLNNMLYFVEIRFKKRRCKIEQTFSGNNGRLVRQRMKVKNLDALYKLHLLAPLEMLN